MLKVLLPPLIGAIIGYCTNYIAVKMLFRPYKPVKIGKFTLPFTPGIIPKRQPDLARAVGNAVGTTLFGEKEIARLLEDDNTKKVIMDKITGYVEANLTTPKLEAVVTNLMGTEKYGNVKDQAADYLTDVLISRIKEIDLKTMLNEEGKALVQSKGGMIAMFVNDSLIASIVDPLVEKINGYLEEDGREEIHCGVEEEIQSLEEKNLNQLAGTEVSTALAEKFSDAYDGFVESKITEIVKSLDISGVVEEKINGMGVKELEELVLSVMKNELGMIVNLGAVIGFVLGLLNLLFV